MIIREKEMMGPLRISVPLHVPINHGGEMLPEIELEEPTFDSLQALDRAGGDIERGILTICACSGLPPSVIRQLRARDMKRVGEECAKLLGEDAPETGENSAPGSRTIFTGPRPS
jgi:hypothetical protein